MMRCGLKLENYQDYEYEVIEEEYIDDLYNKSEIIPNPVIKLESSN